MIKATLNIREFINPEIKIGDKVKIIDGSGFTPLDYDNKDYYIISAYPELTGSNERIKYITAEVISIGLRSNVVCCAFKSVYLQDCVIKIGTGLFRTCSAFLKKV